jgi:hypothetical protein
MALFRNIAGIQPAVKEYSDFFPVPPEVIPAIATTGDNVLLPYVPTFDTAIQNPTDAITPVPGPTPVYPIQPIGPFVEDSTVPAVPNQADIIPAKVETLGLVTLGVALFTLFTNGNKYIYLISLGSLYLQGRARDGKA